MPRDRPIPRIALPAGALELLVLRTLEVGPNHGYAIARHVQRASRDALTVEEGSLYPALHRMEAKGWIQARWAETDTRRRAKVYALTSTGRRRLAAERADWERMTGAVTRVLRARPAEA